MSETPLTPQNDKTDNLEAFDAHFEAIAAMQARTIIEKDADPLPQYPELESEDKTLSVIAKKIGKRALTTMVGGTLVIGASLGASHLMGEAVDVEITKQDTISQQMEDLSNASLGQIENVKTPR